MLVDIIFSLAFESFFVTSRINKFVNPDSIINLSWLETVFKWKCYQLSNLQFHWKKRFCWQFLIFVQVTIPEEAWLQHHTSLFNSIFLNVAQKYSHLIVILAVLRLPSLKTRWLAHTSSWIQPFLFI